jgi:cell wall-associated NlpC family hydrolase
MVLFVEIFGCRKLYVFGGGRNQRDIGVGRFDCSSFIHWAFDQVGVELGPLHSVTTDTLKHMGQSVPPNEMKPGDLVFFDTYKIDGHVGIYAGDGLFIGAQSSTGVVFVDMTSGYWAKVFNGRVQRVG